VGAQKQEFSDCFAAVLQRTRRAKNLSRQALAEKAGLHQTAVGLIERGLRKPNLDTAYRLASALDVELWDVIREAQKNFLNTGRSSGRAARVKSVGK
jgi:transcriptional regulator with XRE-family HTH domain